MLSGLLTWLKPKRDVRDVSLAVLYHRHATPAEHVQHGLVVGKHVGLKSRQAGFTGKLRQGPQEEVCNSAPPVGLCGQEREFGAVRSFARPDRIARTSEQRFDARLFGRNRPR